LVQIWVVGAELGEKFVADFVAGEGGVGVGGIFAPGLVDGVEESFDFGATGLQEGAEDFSLWQREDGVDGAQAFGPGSAEELHEDGLGLVVEGVGGEDAVGVAGGDESVEEVVADGAGCLFDGLVCLGYAVGDICAVEVKRDVEVDAEVFDELLVGVGLCSAKTVVDVDCAEAYAEGFVFGRVCRVKSQEERDGVCTAGDGDADAVSGLDVRAVEGESWRHCTYVSWSVTVSR
jgi:hypothetical protein